jgi:hypothetical protein
MAETSWPFDSQTSSENDWSYLMRHLTAMQEGGVIGTPASTALKVTGDSTGMQVKLAAGYAIVRGHMYYNSATITLAIATSAATARIDSVVLKLDPTANTITAGVVTGTAGSGTAPSLTGNQTDTGAYWMEIGRVNVGASVSTIAAGNVTDLRQFIGAKVGTWSNTSRPAGTTQFPLVTGLMGWNTDSSQIDVWNGSAWVSPTSSIPAASITTPSGVGLTVAQGGTGVTSMTAGFIKYVSGTAVTSGNGVVASDITSAEQANITAGKIRAGGTSGGTATTVFVQSGTPTANATGDLWFW